MPECLRRPRSAAGVPRKVNCFGNGSPRLLTAHSRFPNAMSAFLSAPPTLSHG